MRAADLRFVLPRIPERVAVVGLPTVAAAFASLGLLVAVGQPSDLVVASAGHVAHALELGGVCTAVVGGPRRLARRLPGRSVGRLVVIPSIDEARVFAPLARSIGPAAGADHLAAPTLALRWQRAGLALAERGANLPGTSWLTTSSAAGGPPHAITEAARYGVPLDARWTLVAPGRSDANRLLLLAGSAGSREAEWAIRIARRPEHREAFEREWAARRTLHRVAPRLAARYAPEFLGPIEIGSVAGSVGRFAPGAPMAKVLASSTGRADKLAIVGQVCDFVRALGRTTRTAPDQLARVRQRSEQDTMRYWRRHGAPTDLVATLPPIPGVFQHGDLGGSNILVARDRPDGLTVVDWEWGEHPAYPLWDLVHLLAAALVEIDAPGDLPARRSGTLALFRGDLASSPLLFAQLREAAAELDIPSDAVGPLVTLFFLEREWAHRHLAGSGDDTAEPIWSVGARWLADPALGPRWAAWSR